MFTDDIFKINDSIFNKTRAYLDNGKLYEKRNKIKWRRAKVFRFIFFNSKNSFCFHTRFKHFENCQFSLKDALDTTTLDESNYKNAFNLDEFDKGYLGNYFKNK